MLLQFNSSASINALMQWTGSNGDAPIAGEVERAPNALLPASQSPQSPRSLPATASMPLSPPPSPPPPPSTPPPPPSPRCVDVAALTARIVEVMLHNTERAAAKASALKRARPARGDAADGRAHLADDAAMRDAAMGTGDGTKHRRTLR